MTREITSTKNSFFKEILDLQDNKTRKKSLVFGVEGLREIKSALKNDYKIETLCLCPSLFKKEEKKFLEENLFEKSLIWNFSEPCFDKLLMRKKSSGLYFVFQKKEKPQFIKPANPLYLILDGIEKPANLGAILRSCDAGGVAQIFLTNSKVDPYHPHVIRNSLGAAFSIPCSSYEEEELLELLEKEKVKVFASYLNEKSKPYFSHNFEGPVAFVLGSEDKGISDFWKSSSTKKIIIPMEGTVDSLNVSVASAILIFEAKRQRGKNVQKT